MKRDSWDKYFADIAATVANRSTCQRAKVGAVFVSHDYTILSTGYNGSMSGAIHCPNTGCVMVDGHCSYTIHAEMNGVAQAAKRGISLDHSTLYVTHYPCWNCFKVLVNAGIVDIKYTHEYKPDTRVFDAAKQLDIAILWNDLCNQVDDTY